MESHEQLRQANAFMGQELDELRRSVREMKPEQRYDPGYWRGFMDASRILSSLPQKQALDTAVQNAQRRLFAELNSTVWGE